MGDNVNELERYYRTIQPGDLLGKYTLKTFSKGKVPDGDAILQKINETLIHTGDRTGSGLLTFKEIIHELGTLFKKGQVANEKDFHDRIKIFHDEATSLPGAKDAYLNDEKKQFTMGSILKIDSSKDTSKKFGVIMSTSPMVSISVRDVNKVSLFMNTIPTIEMSRCMPHLDIIFQFKREEVGPKSLRSPSLLKFLNGGLELSRAGKADLAMFNAAQDTESGPGGQKKTVFTAGMELATATQTLFNPASIEGGSARRHAPILDAFRPFMSIESFEVHATKSTGMFSYKTAKLNLILHDRSRLAEISDFVRPEVYTNTTLSISYGWKHPDGINSDNAYGDLLNQMIVKNEKYGIVNVSFSFDNAQQVHITLSLAMKGAQEMRIVKISEGDGYADNQRELEKLMEDVNRLREKAGLKKPEFVNKEIRSYQILDSVSNGQLMTGFKKGEIPNLIAQLSKNPNSEAHKQLAEALDKIFNEKEGFLEKQNSTIKSFIKGKMDKLREGPDPFLDATTYADEIAKNGLQADFKPGDPRRPKKFVSLAKVMLVFAVEPLLASPNFDEIQLIFYQFNSQAGKARDVAIGSFPVEIAQLDEVFNDHIHSKRNVDMTVNEFVLLLQSAIINDPRALAYGLRNKYKKDSEGKAVYSGAKIEDDFAEIMKGQGGSFKFPAIEAYVETRGGRVLKNGETTHDKALHDILRIHVFDKQASPYDQFMQMLTTQTGLQQIVERADKFYANQQVRDVINLIKSNDVGLTGSDDDTKTGEVRVRATSAEEIKRVVSSALPSLTYGSNNSAIISANLATQQNQLLSTVQMLRTAGRQNNTEPNGSAVGGIPLRVIPCQLDMETFGCPLLNINQQFFIDFSTGTTADNIYLLTNLEHKIKQGSFTSHLKFVPLDSYGVLESIISKVDQLSAILKKDAAKIKPK